MNLNFTQKAAFGIYNLSWNLAIPLLRFNKRLREGFDQRTLTQLPDAPAKLWIQAASAGEAYLVWELLKRLSPYEPVNILLTSNTRQGIEILDRAIEDITPNERGITAISAYFPFDKPGIMQKAISYIQPRVMVLLETELWPGMLLTLKKSGIKCIIVNGRITNKSIRGYRIILSLWPAIRPDEIMAISKEDAHRYAILFNYKHVTTMPNMKYDRLVPAKTSDKSQKFLGEFILPDTPFIVLGSIRKEEEKEVMEIIKDILREVPQVVFGIFPRHLNRMTHWEKGLRRRSIPYQFRSALKSPPVPGSAILWDVFGELTAAYSYARSAFIGGTLAPLGGQNFLEALTSGVSPVIGPHWDNFSWVSSEIFENGLVRQVSDHNQVARILIRDIQKGYNRTAFYKKALAFIKEHQGGSNRASNVICEYLKG